MTHAASSCVKPGASNDTGSGDEGGECDDSSEQPSEVRTMEVHVKDLQAERRASGKELRDMAKTDGSPTRTGK